MTTLNPTPIGFDPDEALLEKVADALGYDLEMIEKGEDPGGKCPCCAIDDVMDLVKAEAEKAYRKGWQRIIDAETPSVADLIFDMEMETANLPPPEL
jgi:hypothetical protein